MKEKGTFKGHLCKMMSALYLWTSQVSPTRLIEALKSDLCFSYDNLLFDRISNEPDTQDYKLVFDFGDMQVEYVLTFKLSEKTKRWVLSDIK